MKQQPAGQGQAGSGHETVLLIWTLSSSVPCLGSSAEHGASTGWESGGDARRGSVGAPLSKREPSPSQGEAGVDVYDYIFPPARRAGTGSAAPSTQPPQPSPAAVDGPSEGWWL